MRTRITAHSGADDTVENSLEFIYYCIGTGANALEVDVRRDKHGELVLSHDILDAENYDFTKIRLKDVLDRKGDATEKDIHLLKYGRHFVSDNNIKIIVSRTADEGNELKKLLNKNDLMFITSNFNGAMVIIPEGYNPKEDDIILACRLAVRYSKGRDEENVEVKYGNVSTNFSEVRYVSSLDQEELEKYNIN